MIAPTFELSVLFSEWQCTCIVDAAHVIQRCLCYGFSPNNSDMRTDDSDEIGRLMNVLESDAEECWPLYEEAGRIVV